MTNAEHRRLTNWRLKVLQTAMSVGNVARTCRHFGISRKTFYKWRQRRSQHGDAGLADRARTPHHSPNSQTQSSRSDRVSRTRRGRVRSRTWS
jgi:transposase-like protein